MADIRTREQERVAAALRHIATIADGDVESYHRVAANFGPLVVNNGLAGALAFVVATKKSNFVDHLQEWVGSRPEFKKLLGTTLLEKMSKAECGAADYRLMTQEALLYANWLKRLAGAKKNK